MTDRELLQSIYSQIGAQLVLLRSHEREVEERVGHCAQHPADIGGVGLTGGVTGVPSCAPIWL